MMQGMEGYRKSSHSVYKLHCHFGFTTKYRKPVLRGEIGTEVRDIIRQVCTQMEVEILTGHVAPDHEQTGNLVAGAEQSPRAPKRFSLQRPGFGRIRVGV